MFGRTEDSSRGRLPNPRPSGHQALRMLRDQLDAVEKRGVRCRLTRIEITPWDHEDGSELRFEFALEGEKPEGAFRQVRQVFAKACSADGPFTGLVSASGTPSADEAGDRTYQLSLRLQLVQEPETRADRDKKTESELEKKKGEQMTESKPKRSSRARGRARR